MALASALFLPEGSLGFALPGRHVGQGVIRKRTPSLVPGGWRDEGCSVQWWGVGVRLGWGSLGKSEEPRVKAAAHSAWLHGEPAGSQAG